MSAGQGGAGEADFKAPMSRRAQWNVRAGFKAPAMRSIVGMPAEVSNDVEAEEESGEDMFARAGMAAE